MTSLSAIAAVALGGLALASVTLPVLPTHWLVGLVFAVQASQDTWEFGGVFVDSTDMAFLLLGLSLAVRGMPPGTSLRASVPRLGVWCALALLLAAAYAASPDGQVHMTDPARIAYQLYRYALRMVVLYPAACLLVADGRRFDDVMRCMVWSATAFAVMSFAQGYRGEWGTGPFATKNVLGAALAPAAVVVLADLLGGRLSALSVGCGLVLLRGLLFASSRGAFVGVVLGSAVTWMLLARARVQTRAGTLLAAGAALLGLALILQPGVMEWPTIARFFTATDVGQETFVWRLEQRWPHFVRRALERPWLGWGKAVDESLGRRANTPHNGYLALAVTHGIPVLALYLLFACITLRDAHRLAVAAPDPDDRVRAAAVGGALACMLVHTAVDAVIALPFVSAAFWVFAAWTAGSARRCWARPRPDDVPVPALAAPAGLRS